MMKHDVQVLARQRWNDTLLDVTRGQRVSVSATGEWIDSTIRCTPDGFERPWLEPVKWTRRDPRSPWFALIAVVGHMKRPCFRIGSQGEFIAGRDGRLYLYANDAWLFYFNNMGSVMASIEITDS